MDDGPKITVEPGENLTGDIGDRYCVTALEYAVTFVLSRRSEQVEQGSLGRLDRQLEVVPGIQYQRRQRTRGA